jgi:hypothetical protein
MATELHLAEDTFALHLLLQHLESLVDIVFPDENLHGAFLLDRAAEWARRPGRPARWRTDRHKSSANSRENRSDVDIWKRHRGCQFGRCGDLGASPSGRQKINAYVFAYIVLKLPVNDFLPITISSDRQSG